MLGFLGFMYSTLEKIQPEFEDAYFACTIRREIDDFGEINSVGCCEWGKKSEDNQWLE